jgi:hypothetical protein
MVKKSFFLLTILTVIGIVVLTGCAGTQTINKADQLALNGVAFADSIAPLVDESFVLAVTADSLVLTQARENIPNLKVRGTRLKQSDKHLETRLKILRDIKRHANLLRSYFISIKAITQTDAASGITDATKGLVEQMSKLEPKIAKATIGDTPVSNFIEPTVKLAVAGYQNAVLRQELSVRADIIDREIGLQEAALIALYEQMRADKELQISVEVKNPIFREYTGTGKLPSNWTKKRVDAFELIIEIDSYEKAVKAAKALRQSWQAFAEDRLDSATLLDLTRLVQEMVELAGKIKADQN